MKPGSLLRNIFVGTVYLLLLPFLFWFLPVLIGALVFRNYGGWANSLARLPGISADGGSTSGVLAAFYVVGGLLMFGLLLGGASVGGTDAALEDGSPDVDSAATTADIVDTDDTVTSADSVDATVTDEETAIDAESPDSSESEADTGTLDSETIAEVEFGSETSDEAAAEEETATVVDTSPSSSTEAQQDASRIDNDRESQSTEADPSPVSTTDSVNTSSSSSSGSAASAPVSASEPDSEPEPEPVPAPEPEPEPDPEPAPEPVESPLAVTGMNVNVGFDTENEYIVLENVGDEDLVMSNYTVTDRPDGGTGISYTFPSGYTLESGDQVRVVTGDGSDTDNERFMGSGRPVWRAAGDVIYVYDASGEVVVRHPYGDQQ